MVSGISRIIGKKAPLSGSSFVYAAGPLLTLAVLIVSMAWCGIYPFGDHAYVARDGAIQYVGYYGWYHNVLTGQASLTYSLSKGLGGATFGLFAYYLSSPLALLAVFFDAPDSAKLFSLIVPVKLVLASFTCGYALIKRTGHRSVALSLLGCAYALSAYSFSDGLNVMWLDGMALAPLAVLGVYRLVRGGKVGLLFTSCAFSIICNWYIGYMVCLFAVLWFFVELALRRDAAAAPALGAVSVSGHASGLACISEPEGASAAASGRVAGKGAGVHAASDLPSLPITFARFAAAMALAVGVGCAVLLPVAIEQLQSAGLGGDSGFFATLSEGVGLLDVRQLIAAMVNPDASFAGATNAVAVPWVLLALAAVFFLLPRAGGARRKIAMGAVMALLIVSFLFKPLDMVWTGFVRADSYNPRYYFLFLFVLCLAAAWAVAAISGTLESKARNGALARTASRRVAAGALAVMLAAGTAVLATGGLSETDLNGYSSNSVSRYHDYMQQLSQAHEQAEQSSELGVVRMENAASSSVSAMRTTAPQSTVDALSSMMTTGEYMAFTDSSLSHYSSTADGSMKELLGSLGYCLLPGSRGISTYHSPLLLTDSLLGVEYVLDDKEPAGCTAVSDSIALPSSEGSDVRLYRNNSALGFGFGIPSQARSVSFGSDPFCNQELLIGELSGADASGLYVPEQATLSDATGSNSDGVFEYTWNISVSQDGPLYLWVAAAPAGTRVVCNGEFLQTTRSYEFDTNVMYLGEFRAGDSVSVCLSSSTAYSYAEGDVSVRTLDAARAKEILAGMQASQLSLARFDDGRIEGTFTAAAGQKLLLTVPATSGWTATVDGAPTAVESVNGLMAIETGEGEHTVALSYETPGLAAGVAVCVVSLVLFAAWMALRRYRGLRRR